MTAICSSMWTDEFGKPENMCHFIQTLKKQTKAFDGVINQVSAYKHLLSCLIICHVTNLEYFESYISKHN